MQLTSTIQSIEILQAIHAQDWAKMLEFFPEGIEHRTYKYTTLEDFTEWDTYEDYARYISPARQMLIDLCMEKALSLLTLDK